MECDGMLLREVEVSVGAVHQKEESQDAFRSL